MQTPYTFVWLSADGDVAAVDGARCLSDMDALRTAEALLRDDEVYGQWRNCGRIETYAGARFVDQVWRASR